MTKKIIIFSFMSVLFNLPVQGCDQRELSFGAHGLNTQIWAGVEVTKDTIGKCLGVISEEEKLDKKYLEDENFFRFIKDIKEKNYLRISDNTFQEFVETMNQLYREASNTKTKAALYLLLEEVQEKFLSDYNMFMTYKKAKESRELNMKPINREKVQDFLNKYVHRPNTK